MSVTNEIAEDAIDNNEVVNEPEKKPDALTLTADNYGPLWKYVDDDDITDTDFNGVDLWLTDIEGRRIRIEDHGLTDEFIRAFTQRVANKVSKPFNKMNPLLEAETSTLRISVVHESAAISGRSICLRKSLPKVRITTQGIMDTNYIPRPVLNLLVNCIQSKMNVVIGGEPGAGKTEFAKYLTQYIDKTQRMITIEDSPEWHFRTINPGHDVIEMRVSPEFDYSMAIKTCLRQNPKWIALSEARGEEAKWLITAWSTGVNGVTTIHTDDVRKIPGRLISMMNDRNDAERMISDVFDFVNVGIMVRRKAMLDGTAKRYVDQVGLLFREGDEQGVMPIVMNGEFVAEMLPKDVAFRLKRAGVENPFESAAVDAMLDDVYVHTPLDATVAAEPVEDQIASPQFVKVAAPPTIESVEAVPTITAPPSNIGASRPAVTPAQTQPSETALSAPPLVSEPLRRETIKRDLPSRVARPSASRAGGQPTISRHGARIASDTSGKTIGKGKVL